MAKTDMFVQGCEMEKQSNDDAVVIFSDLTFFFCDYFSYVWESIFFIYYLDYLLITFFILGKK